MLRRHSEAIIAIFAGVSTRLRARAIFVCVPIRCEQMLHGHRRIGWMQRVRSLLLVSSGEIGRRFARFVAIAAASLPEVGA